MTITADKIYQSILLRAADIYELEYEDVERDIGQQLDPVVRFLAGACASELERVYHHLHDTESRLQQRLAKALLPAYFHLPQPAHALATATPDGDPLIISETTTFTTKAEEEEAFPFSPIFPAQLLPANIQLIATDTHIIDPRRRPKLKRHKESLVKTETRRILIGIEAEAPITNWRGASLFFDLKSYGGDNADRELFFAALKNSRCFLGRQELSVGNGLPQGELLLEDYLNGNENLQRIVRTRYERQFLTFNNEAIPEVAPKKVQAFLPKWFASSMPGDEKAKEMIEKADSEIKKPLYWLQIFLSRPVELTLLAERLSVRLNVFPIVNRRLNGHANGEHHYLQTNSIKWISLQPEEDFASIRCIYEERPPDYQEFTYKPFAEFKEERRPSYTLRHGGIGRWDDFNAWQRLAYIINILQDNYKHSDLIQKAAASLSLEDVHHLLGKKILKSAAEERPTSNIYVLLHSGVASGMRVRIEYWTSQGEDANGIPAKAALECTSKEKASLKKESIGLVTTTTGGRAPRNATEQLQSMKEALLSRGRIVTREDIKVFCQSFLGDQLQDVSVLDGVGPHPKFNFGMTRLLTVELVPNAQARQDDWEGICQQLQVLMEQKSASTIPLQVKLQEE